MCHTLSKRRKKPVSFQERLLCHHLQLRGNTSPFSPASSPPLLPPPFHLHFLVGKSQQMKGRGMAAAGSSNRRQQRHSVTTTSAVASSFFCHLGHSKREGRENVGPLLLLRPVRSRRKYALTRNGGGLNVRAARGEADIALGLNERRNGRGD